MRLNSVEWSQDNPTNGSILFLHGMGGTARIWNPIATRLQKHFRCVAFDQRGHGNSRDVPNNDWTPEAYGHDVVDTLRELQIRPCIGVGHSMGVRTLVAAAFREPALFSGLVLIDLGFTGPAGGGFGERLYQFLSRLQNSYPDRATAQQHMSELSPDTAITAYLLAVSQVDPVSGEITFPFERNALLKTIEEVRGFTLVPWLLELAKSGMPILALRGSLSTVWQQSEFEEEQRRFGPYPNVQFEIIEGTGHGLPFEKRLQFCSRLESFALNYS